MTQNEDTKKSQKWFMNFPYLEFDKTIEEIDEIDSAKALIEKYKKLVKIDPSDDIDLPKTNEEKKEFSKVLANYKIAEAAEILKTLAASGDAEAQYLLSELYYRGKCIEPSITESNKWLEMSAEQGYLPAMKGLYCRYKSESYLSIYRELTPEERGYSPEKAKILWPKLKQKCQEMAENGNEDAKFIINKYDDDGNIDNVKFVEFLKREAPNGDARVMCTLASWISCEDLNESKYLYMEAGKLGDTYAILKTCFGYTGLSKKEFEKEYGEPAMLYNPYYSIEEFNKCESWLRRAAKEKSWYGNIARALLGEYYLNEYLGRHPCITGGTEYGSVEEALGLFKASMTEDVSKYYLAEMYYFGYGVERSVEKAKKWLGLVVKNRGEDSNMKEEGESIYDRAERMLLAINKEEDQKQDDTKAPKGWGSGYQVMNFYNEYF